MFTKEGETVELLDLQAYHLPLCDGSSCYGEPEVIEVGQHIQKATHILFCGAIYNYDYSASAKNLIELTGKEAWTGKTVGFMAAAGGNLSYMAPLGLINSLQLDFRAQIIPRYVYAGPSSFANGELVDTEIKERIHGLVQALIG
jgi:FMN reductase